MLKGRKSHQTPTFLEGTPGLYVKRESPPRVPSTAPTPSKADATGSKPSRSLSGSTVSLMNTAVQQNITTPMGASGSSTPALVASHLYSSAASIATIGGPIPQTPTNKGQGFGNFSGYAGLHRDASGRRLSHTPIRPHRRAAPRHELSSHSFNNPPSSHSNRNVAFSAGLRGYADSVQRQVANNRRHLASSLSFGNVVEPLSEISSQHGTNDNISSTGNSVQQQVLRQKSSISSVSGPSNHPSQISIQANTNRQVSGSLQSLPGRMPIQSVGSSILQENYPSTADAEADLPLPHNWELTTTPDGVRYYIDHNNKRTSWIHPLAVENLVPGWIKIFDQVHGVVYYNENDHRSQFEHPGLAGPPISASQNKVSMHPTASVQSMADHMIQSQQQQMPHQYHQTHQILEEPVPTPTYVEDLNIIDNTGVPEWITMYSEAPFESDHLLDWKLFQLPQLEEFDHMLLKLYKQDAINTVIRYERPRREINHELAQRQITS
ncbi:WW domain-containing protein [Ditylenchus destructor]|uniref:WW domain-containing protein n=1 Tax=Ditylenchus destructor TaxID=166010 RepID=A0AAD4N025_9BILA|nr:WW domain-containing protein [Ditylenchus destructor]